MIVSAAILKRLRGTWATDVVVVGVLYSLVFVTLPTAKAISLTADEGWELMKALLASISTVME